jgi:hypothetical protein
MVANTRDRNIDSSRREDSRVGTVDRCEVIRVYPHVAPLASGDKNFNTVDLQLIDRPYEDDGSLPIIERAEVNTIQHDHGRFQGRPFNYRVGDLVLVYWLSERRGIILGALPTDEQEPVCRSQADSDHQEFVFKLCPWEAPHQDPITKSFTEFPDPKHPECYKWWPKTRDSLWIFDCLEGHNTPSCCGQACNSLDDHQSSTCFKNFSDISPTTIDKAWRFKFLHHCGSYWWFDDDGQWRICGASGGKELGFIHHYADGKIEINSPVEVLIKAPKITLDGDVEITGNNLIDGGCTHGPCSCAEAATTHVDLDTGRVMKQEGNNQVPIGSQTAAKVACCNGGKMACCTTGNDLYELIDGEWTLLGENVADLCYSSDGMLYIIDTPATSLYRREINGDWTNLAGQGLSVAAASATISYVIGADEHLWKNDAGSWTNPENSTAIIDISVSNDGTVYAIRKSDGALLKFNGSGYDVVSSDLAVKEISARDAYHILGIGDADDIVYLWNDVRWASQGVTAASIGISSAG